MSLLQDPGSSVNQDLFTAIADPTRRSILELLAANGQMPATDIYQKFDVTPPAVSQHLKVLRDANLVQVEKSAQKHLYSLNPKKMQDLQDWVQQMTDLWDERFNSLDSLLEGEKRKHGKRR